MSMVVGFAALLIGVLELAHAMIMRKYGHDGSMWELTIGMVFLAGVVFVIIGAVVLVMWLEFAT